MIFNGKNKMENQQRLIESLHGLTQSEKSDIQFEEITWDIEKPILKLKGINGTPDFTITFGINDNPARIHIMPDCDPSYDMTFEMPYTNFKEFVNDILMTCSVIILRMSINPYLGYYNGHHVLLKFTPENKLLFSSHKSLEIDIETITDSYLMDSLRVPEFTSAILIETDSDNSYYIALEKPDEFGMELAQRRSKLENIEHLLAS